MELIRIFLLNGTITGKIVGTYESSRNWYFDNFFNTISNLFRQFKTSERGQLWDREIRAFGETATILKNENLRSSVPPPIWS